MCSASQQAYITCALVSGYHPVCRYLEDVMRPGRLEELEAQREQAEAAAAAQEEAKVEKPPTRTVTCIFFLTRVHRRNHQVARAAMMTLKMRFPCPRSKKEPQRPRSHLTCTDISTHICHARAPYSSLHARQEGGNGEREDLALQAEALSAKFRTAHDDTNAKLSAAHAELSAANAKNAALEVELAASSALANVSAFEQVPGLDDQELTALEQRVRAEQNRRTELKIQRATEAARKEAKEEAEERMRDERQCPICLDNDKNCMFNCGHRACMECAQKLDVCPVCREPVTSRTQVFD